MIKHTKLNLGDKIAKITKALHIPHCSKCEKRRIILNEIGEKGWSLKEIRRKLKDCC